MTRLNFQSISFNGQVGQSAIVVGCLLMLGSLGAVLAAELRVYNSDSRCLAAIRGVALATQEYSADWRGLLPYVNDKWGVAAWNWAALVEAEGEKCPLATEVLPYVGAPSCWTDPKYLDGTSRPGERVLSIPISMDEAKFPSNKVLGGERRPWHDGPSDDFLPSDFTSVVFVDGHAERLGCDTFKAGVLPGRSKPWEGPLSYYGTLFGFAGRDIE